MPRDGPRPRPLKFLWSPMSGAYTHPAPILLTRTHIRDEFVRYSRWAPRFCKQRPSLVASVRPHDAERDAQGQPELSQGPFEFAGGNVFELARLNRAIAQLARPALSDEWLAPLSPAELFDLGVFVGSAASQRKELIQRLWSRKRQLMRHVDPSGGWSPQQPVA